MPGRPRSSSMSTPLSYVDDGAAVDQRMPSGGRWDISKWIDATTSSQAAKPSAAGKPSAALTDSTYTGSFIDDGADMMAPDKGVPGFGNINPKFYNKGKKKEDKGEWSEEMQRAVQGDIWGSLRTMNKLANVRVADPDEEEAKQRVEKKRDDDEEEDGVWICLKCLVPQPKRYVIMGDDESVYVIDEDGNEYDSGPPGQGPPQMKLVRRPKDGERGREKHTKDKKKHRRRRSSPPKPMTTIPEAETPEADEGVMSPTRFFMTGGSSGCTSTTPVKPPPGAWPSPPPSPVKETPRSRASKKSRVSSETASQDSWRKDAFANPYAFPVKESSASKSSRRSKTTSSSGSKDLWEEVQHRYEDAEVNASRKTKPFASATASTTGSKASWKRDVEDFFAHKTSKSAASPASSVTGPNDPWGQHADNQSMDSYEKPLTSSNVSIAGSKDSWTKYKDMESFSTKSSRKSAKPSVASSKNSSGVRKQDDTRSKSSSHRSISSRVASIAASQNAWHGGGSQWGHETDNQSNFSTYKAPTVEDAPSTSQDEMQGWDAARSNKGSVTGGSKKASGWGSERSSYRGSRNGSGRGWDESEKGSRSSRNRGSRKKRDESGYDEDNDTWLNADWGGVKVREAEWRKR